MAVVSPRILPLPSSRFSLHFYQSRCPKLFRVDEDNIGSSSQFVWASRPSVP